MSAAVEPSNRARDCGGGGAAGLRDCGAAGLRGGGTSGVPGVASPPQLASALDLLHSSRAGRTCDARPEIAVRAVPDEGARDVLEPRGGYSLKTQALTGPRKPLATSEPDEDVGYATFCLAERQRAQYKRCAKQVQLAIDEAQVSVT